MYYVYVLFNEDNSNDTYLGYSSDLRKRVMQHSSNMNASTKGRRWKLVYYEAYLSEKVARNRERKLKHDGRVKRFLFERIRGQFE